MPRIGLRAVAVACALAVLPAGAAQVVWTGGAPIFAYPGGEVADALDCGGLNNTGIPCRKYLYWGYGNNWGGVVPAAGDDVQIISTETIWVQVWDSPLRGRALPPSAQTVFGSVLQGGGGTLYIDTGNLLHTVQASIDRLTLAGQIVIDGSGSIGQLTNPVGFNIRSSAVIRGNGATTVLSGDLFKVADTQRVTLTGNVTGGVATYGLYDDAVFTTTGQLSGGLTVFNYGSSNGTSDFSAVRSYVNRGTLGGGISIGTLFRNEGTVDLGDSGGLSSVGGGVHSAFASFSGGAASAMVFAGYHTFAAGSSIDSRGAVTFGGNAAAFSAYAPYLAALGNYNDVAGSYRAGSTRVLNSTVFEGDVSPGALTASAPAVFNGPGKVTLSSATVQGGAIWGTAAVDVTGPLVFTGGRGIGTQGGVLALGGITFDGGGSKSIVNLAGPSARVANAGDATLQGGTLALGGQATFANLAGARFDMQGDFGITGTFDSSGQAISLVDNAGRFVKSAGTGVATVTTRLDNRGSVEVASGTLRLLGGGTHTGTFAVTGALDLGGSHVFAASTTLRGDVGLYGTSSLTVNPGVSLTIDSPSLEQRGTVGAVSIANNGAIVNLGMVQVDGIVTTGSVSNQGVMTTRSFTQNAGAAGPASMSQQGVLSATVVTLNAGTFSAGAGCTSNLGQMVVGQARVDNAGAMDVGSLSIGAGAAWGNTGSLTLGRLGSSANLGSFTNGGSVTIVANDLNAGRLRNDGVIVNQGGGTLWVHAGDKLDGSGSFQQLAGVTRVDGTLSQAGGILIGNGGTLAGPGQVIGNVQVAPGGRITPGNSPGTLTINGNLDVAGLSSFDPQTPQLVLELVDATVHDRLAVSGSARFGTGARGAVAWLGGAVPDLDDRFDLLSAAGGVSGSLALEVGNLGTSWSAQAVAGPPGSVSLSFINSAAYQLRAAGQDPAVNNGLLRIATGDYAFNLYSQFGGFSNAGVISNDGRFYNRNASSIPTPGASPGTLAIESGGSFVNGAAAYAQNRGTWLNKGGIDNAGTFLNFADGTLRSGTGNAGSTQPRSLVLNRADAIMGNQGQWVNDVDSTLLNQGSFTNSGTLVNKGLLQNEGGHLQLAAAGTVSGSGAILQGQGTPNFFFGILTSANLQPVGGTVSIDGAVQAGFIGLAGGTLDGTGALKVQGSGVAFQGRYVSGAAVDGVTIRPGHGGGGRLSIDGDLSTVGNNASTLQIDLGPGGATGQLAVDGQLAFGGNLTFDLVGGYLPRVGDSFTFLTASQGSFVFNEVRLQVVDNGGIATPLAGPIWSYVSLDDRRGYLKYTLNGQTDYAIWNLDGSSATLRFSDTLAPVPEPRSGMLLLAGLIAFGLQCRRVRGRHGTGTERQARRNIETLR